MNQQRTVYCVLTLPDDSQEKAFCKKILEAVRRDLPELIFVELVSESKQNRVNSKLRILFESGLFTRITPISHEVTPYRIRSQNRVAHP
jgi:hypothetical protein